MKDSVRRRQRCCRDAASLFLINNLVVVIGSKNKVLLRRQDDRFVDTDKIPALSEIVGLPRTTTLGPLFQPQDQ